MFHLINKTLGNSKLSSAACRLLIYFTMNKDIKISDVVIMDTFNWSQAKTTRVKNELKKWDLMYVKRVGHSEYVYYLSDGFIGARDRALKEG